jgi:hypothetical protein
MTILGKLQQFRNEIYGKLGNGRDALFDLMDAVLTTKSVSSFVELSLSPLFRRKWPSVSEALQDSRPPRDKLLESYCQQIPSEGVTLLAGDHTDWGRLYAVTLKERTYEHHPTPLEGALPVTVGQGYSTLAWVPQMQGSWALPLLHERIASHETPIQKAAAQLRQVCAQLRGILLFLGDGEYGCALFMTLTADLPCEQLLRLRPNRILYRPPAPYSGYGRPAKHGSKFSLKDSQTWGTPQGDVRQSDSQLGQVRIRYWNHLHFKSVAGHPFAVILVERLDCPTAKPLWLIWVAKHHFSFDELWSNYLRRFTIDHWYRFAKQRLHWTLPRLATPEQMETWSDVMPILSWQLWLARPCVEDAPLPWQSPQTQLTPGRVAQSFAVLLARIGAPAPDPKPRGKSPGWPTGQKRTRKPRYPTVKKRYSPPKKQPLAAA